VFSVAGNGALALVLRCYLRGLAEAFPAL